MFTFWKNRKPDRIELPDVVEPRPTTQDRDEVVAICIDLADRIRDLDPALWSRLHRQLDDVGIVAVIPDQQVFDDLRFDAVGREDTDEPARDGLVARTEFCGYADRGRVLRRPQVVVHRTAPDPVEAARDGI